MKLYASCSSKDIGMGVTGVTLDCKRSMTSALTCGPRQRLRTHPDPSSGVSDGPDAAQHITELTEQVQTLDRVINAQPLWVNDFSHLKLNGGDMKLIYFDDLKEGDVFWGDEVLADRSEMLAYNQKNDPWPIHVDEKAAANSPFGGIIASGGYTITLLYRSLRGAYNNYELQWQFLGGFDWKLKFVGPLRPNDKVKVKITILGVRLSGKAHRGVVTLLDEMFNQSGECIMTIEVVCLLQVRPTDS